MAMIRTHHNRENPYVRLNKKALWDEELSLEAVGLWARLLSRPDDWQVSVMELSKSCKCGRDKIYKLLNELIKAGYAYRCQPRIDGEKKKNVFAAYDTHVFEFKVSPDEIKEMFPLTGFPLTENPVTGKADTTKEVLTNSPSSLRSEGTEHKERSATPPVSAEAESLCDFFLKKIKDRSPGFKDPNLVKWRSCFDLLLRVDKRSAEEARRLIEWASTHRWWKSACLSPEKLRKAWDEMTIQMNSESEKSLIQHNRTYALKLKEKYPEQMKAMTFDDKYAINRSAGKEVPFSLPHERFKEVLISLFGGTYVAKGG